MADPSRVVFDSNVLVSAAIYPKSKPGLALAAALEAGSVLISDATLDEEVTEVLERPKFKRYMTADDCNRFLEALIRAATPIDRREPIVACRDPKDDLELAVAGQASCLVFGDEDLLILNPFRGIQIITPAEFLDTQQSEPDPNEAG